MHASSAHGSRRDQDTGSLATGELQLVVVGGDTRGRVIPLSDGMTLGRASDATAQIDDHDVSRHHARLSCDRATKLWQIEDLKSRNGTWINGKRVERVVLQPGDTLRLGARVTLEVASEEVERELRHRQRLELVGRASLGVMHDVNNMLSVGIANLDHLTELPAEHRSEAALRECLAETRLALQRACEIGSRLLRTASADEGSRSRVDVVSLCNEVRGLVQRIMPRSITIEHTPSEPMFVAGFGSQLQQVLVNLCVNARDAMPDGGTLSLSAVREAPSGGRAAVAIRITDTGCGMDAPTLARIFAPFFTTKREGRGFGLGLAMVSEIVTGHGGRIDVDSTVGRGTTFVIRLPEAESAPETDPTTGAPRRVVAGGGAHVLLVDDEPDLRRALRRVLERAGFVVTEAADGAAALAAVRARGETPRLAIVDFHMPRMNGLQTCRALRELVPGLPTLLMSGGPVDMNDAPELKAFVARVLEKPIGRQALLEAIHDLLAPSVAAPRTAHDSSTQTGRYVAISRS